MIQHNTFSTGGFVLHKIPYRAGKLSAWFDAAGHLQDVEKFDKDGRKTGSGVGVAMNHARSVGLRYVGVQQ